MTDDYFFFAEQSVLGATLFALLVWYPLTRWKKTIRVCLLTLNGLAILFFLAGIYLQSQFESTAPFYKLAFLYFFTISCPMGLGFVWKWKPLNFTTVPLLGLRKP